MEIASTQTGVHLRGFAAKRREILQYFLMREELLFQMHARQVGYVRDTMTAHFRGPIAPRGETRFWSFLAEKVSPNFLPGNCFDPPRLDFLPPSFGFSSPRRFNVRICFFCSLEALNKQTNKRGSLTVRKLQSIMKNLIQFCRHRSDCTQNNIQFPARLQRNITQPPVFVMSPKQCRRRRRSGPRG